MSFDTSERLRMCLSALQGILIDFLPIGGIVFFEYMKKPMLASEMNELTVKNNTVTQFKVPHVFPMTFSAQEPPQLCAGDSQQADGATALPCGLPPSGWCAAVDGEAAAPGHAEPDPA